MHKYELMCQTFLHGNMNMNIGQLWKQILFER